MAEMASEITIIDYGMGNLRSVQKAVERVGGKAVISSDPFEVSRAERLILPGVGAFRDAIVALKRQDLVNPIRDHCAADRPFLGICLGLQLLFDVSFEDGEHEGLGIISGDVRRFRLPSEYKIPHMGWNRLQIQKDVTLLRDCPDEPWFYFVHSYYVVPADPSCIAATTDYGIDFVSMVARGNLYATQFHPEKSQSAGMQLLTGFVRPGEELTRAQHLSGERT